LIFSNNKPFGASFTLLGEAQLLKQPHEEELDWDFALQPMPPRKVRKLTVKLRRQGRGVPRLNLSDDDG
jgi:hypothetical protein